MGLVLVTPATSEPVSLAQAKLHVRTDLDDDDAAINDAIAAARQWVEERTGRQLLPATWRLTLNCQPAGCVVLHRAAPLISITSVTYTDTAGATQTLAVTTGYRLDADRTPARLWPAYSTPWPYVREGPAAFSVTFRSGYVDADAVPKALKQAMLLLVGHWYVNREAIIAGQVMSTPTGVDSLIAPYKVELYG